MMFVNDAKKQHQDYVRNAKAECGHAGFPFDTYLFSDLFEDNMPDYKLYIFANVWHLGLDEYEVLRKIHARLSRNHWIPAPCVRELPKLRQWTSSVSSSVGVR